MAMNPVRQKKLIWVIIMLIGAVIAVSLVIYAIRQQTDYYFDATSIIQGKAPQETRIRAVGMVVRGSVVRDQTNPLNIQFQITDFQSTIPVVYQGILPDLFAEGSGIVATGTLQGQTFIATEVLAKHDENYLPPEVAKSLKEDHQARGTDVNQEQFIPAEKISNTTP